MDDPMPSPTASSRSSKSARHSTFTRSSKKSAQTEYSYHRSESPFKCPQTESPSVKNNELARASVSSIATYASTRASDDYLPRPSSRAFPRARRNIYVPDWSPSTGETFARLFPSSRRLMIQHDDSTHDGNMNLRLDREVTTSDGQLVKVTLFHLKMRDLAERGFSLRRYWRHSGREVCSSKRRYVKTVPLYRPSPRSTRPRASTDPFNNERSECQHEGSGTDSDEAEVADQLRAFEVTNHFEATVRTNAITVDFSNYAQVILEPRRVGQRKQYDFEYWGEYYSWKRRALRDGGEIITSYELVNVRTNQRVSSITPDTLSPEEVDFEAGQGAWIPACSMRIQQQNISDDLGDVIVATGLMVLTDDCIPASTYLN